jgi:hypothetical protein
MTDLAWYRDRDARALILFGYLPWLAGLNLAWEAAHVRLYTIWTEAEPGYIAFSVVHCTLGDILIGGAALLLALILGREGALARWHWPRIALLTVVFGAGYTIFSEWMNITLLRSWIYADAMPTVAIGGFRLGLTPLAQWLVVPPLALYLAQRTVGIRNRNEQAPA